MKHVFWMNKVMHRYVGAGPKPEESTFYNATYQSYEKNPVDLGSFQLIVRDPTIKIWYRDDKPRGTLLVAPRGTLLRDWNDMTANASIAINRLSKSDRYIQDANVLRRVVQKYPPAQNDYYLASHSLGGAISLQFKRDFPYLKDAVLYNSAFQPVELFKRHKDVKFYWTPDDFLYKLGGRFLGPNAQVVPNRYSLGISGIDALSGHLLSSFGTLYGGSQTRNEQMSLREPPLDYVNRQQLFSPEYGVVKTVQTRAVYDLAAARALEGSPDAAPIHSTVYGNTGMPLHGSGFWGDFAQGFKQGFTSVINPALSAAKTVAGFIPHPGAQAASTVLGLAGYARPKRRRSPKKRSSRRRHSSRSSRSRSHSRRSMRGSGVFKGQLTKDMEEATKLVSRSDPYYRDYVRFILELFDASVNLLNRYSKDREAKSHIINRFNEIARDAANHPEEDHRVVVDEMIADWM